MEHTIDDSDRLKPCPFCGGEAEFGEVENESDPNFGGRFVMCQNPLCEASSALIFACGDDPKPLLLERWNNRPSGELRELQELCDDLSSSVIAAAFLAPHGNDAKALLDEAIERMAARARRKVSGGDTATKTPNAALTGAEGVRVEGAVMQHTGD